MNVDSGIYHVIILTRPPHTASDDSCGGGLGTRLECSHFPALGRKAVLDEHDYKPVGSVSQQLLLNAYNSIVRHLARSVELIQYTECPNVLFYICCIFR